MDIKAALGIGAEAGQCFCYIDAKYGKPDFDRQWPSDIASPRFDFVLEKVAREVQASSAEILWCGRIWRTDGPSSLPCDPFWISLLFDERDRECGVFLYCLQHDRGRVGAGSFYSRQRDAGVVPVYSWICAQEDDPKGRYAARRSFSGVFSKFKAGGWHRRWSYGDISK